MLISKFILEPVVRYLLRSSELLSSALLVTAWGSLRYEPLVFPGAGAFFAVSPGSLPTGWNVVESTKIFWSDSAFMTLGEYVRPGRLIYSNVGGDIRLYWLSLLNQSL